MTIHSVALNEVKVLLTTVPKTPKLGKKQQLLRATEDLFGSKGFHNTQVSDITGLAATGVGTFYRYFEDKESALRELLSDFFVPIRVRIAALREGIELRPPVEQVDVIRQTYRLMISEITRRPMVATIMFRSGHGVSADINQIMWDFVTAMVNDIVQDLQRATDAGLLSVKRMDIVAHCVAGVLLQVAHKLVANPEPSIDEAVETCTYFTLGGLSGFATDAYYNANAAKYHDLMKLGDAMAISVQAPKP